MTRRTPLARRLTRRLTRSLVVGLVGVATTAVGPAIASASTSAGAPTTARVLLVPTAYPSIQAAVDAARPGDQVTVRPGVYREQLTIATNLALVGSGAGRTTILAPRRLVPGGDGTSSIVEITDGALVQVSGLTVSGPGSGRCTRGALGAGIRVSGGSHLVLTRARVTHIHDTPIAACPHSGEAVLVDDSGPGPGSLTITHSVISDYQAKGVLVLSEGTPVTITDDVVTGPTEVSADGIDVLFTRALVARNVVTDNACRVTDPLCGPDFFNDFQHAAVFAGGFAGSRVTDNRLSRNQIGIYAIGSARTDHNRLVDNSYVGLALQDGDYHSVRDQITGGVDGVAVIAASADTRATLADVRIRSTTGRPVRTFACCGVAATVRIAR